jgi:hypothetical protein
MKKIFISILVLIFVNCLANEEGVNYTIINKAPKWAVEEDPNIKEITRIINWAVSYNFDNGKNEEMFKTFVDNYHLCNYYAGRLDGRINFLRKLKHIIGEQVMQSKNSVNIEDYDTHSMVVESPSLLKDQQIFINNLYDEYWEANNILSKKINRFISFRVSSYLGKYHVSVAKEKMNEIAMQNLYARNQGEYDVGSISEKELKERNFVSGYLTPFINASQNEGLQQSPAAAGVAFASILTRALEDYIKTTDMYQNKNLKELLGKWYNDKGIWIFGIYEDSFRTGDKYYDYDEVVKISRSFYILKIKHLGDIRKYYFRNVQDQSMEYSSDCVHFISLYKK